MKPEKGRLGLLVVESGALFSERAFDLENDPSGALGKAFRAIRKAS